MYLYRMANGLPTYQSRKRFDAVLSKLGRILEVRGYRFQSTRGSGEGRYTTKHERVIVKGTKGTARFEGLCWGYHGEGPRGLVELLRKIGLVKMLAEEVAFYSPRTDSLGNDWIVTLPANYLSCETDQSIGYISKGTLALTRKEVLRVKVQATLTRESLVAA